MPSSSRVRPAANAASAAGCWLLLRWSSRTGVGRGDLGVAPHPNPPPPPRGASASVWLPILGLESRSDRRLQIDYCVTFSLGMKALAAWSRCGEAFQYCTPDALMPGRPQAQRGHSDLNTNTNQSNLNHHPKSHAVPTLDQQRIDGRGRWHVRTVAEQVLIYALRPLPTDGG